MPHLALAFVTQFVLVALSEAVLHQIFVLKHYHRRFLAYLWLLSVRHRQELHLKTLVAH